MNEKQILERLAAAKNQIEYDSLLDRYIFKINKYNRNSKHNRKFNMFSANQMQHIKRKEYPINPDFL